MSVPGKEETCGYSENRPAGASDGHCAGDSFSGGKAAAAGAHSRVKLGLANIVTVFAVFALRAKAGAQVLFARIFLECVFGGNFGAILYAGAGGLLAILTTIALRPVLTRKQLWVAGSLGAAAHSVGQMIVAAAVTGTPTVLIYLPVLLICSVVTGIFTGLCAQFLVNRGGDPWKIFSK